MTVGWGAALHAVVRAMPDIELDGVMVLQAMGSIGGSDPSVDGSDLARTLASRLNGDFRFLPAPHIVSSVEAARSLLADRTIAGTLALAARAEVAHHRHRLDRLGALRPGAGRLLRRGPAGPAASEPAWSATSWAI